MMNAVEIHNCRHAKEEIRCLLFQNTTLRINHAQKKPHLHKHTNYPMGHKSVILRRVKMRRLLPILGNAATKGMLSRHQQMTSLESQLINAIPRNKQIRTQSNNPTQVMSRGITIRNSVRGFSLQSRRGLSMESKIKAFFLWMALQRQEQGRHKELIVMSAVKLIYKKHAEACTRRAMAPGHSDIPITLALLGQVKFASAMILSLTSRDFAFITFNFIMNVKIHTL